MLYDDTDRPKKLHSKMLLSDVMQERVAQMDYAQQIKALKRHQDEAFLVQQAARLKVGLRPLCIDDYWLICKFFASIACLHTSQASKVTCSDPCFTFCTGS